MYDYIVGIHRRPTSSRTLISATQAIRLQGRLAIVILARFIRLSLRVGYLFPDGSVPGTSISGCV